MEMFIFSEAFVVKPWQNEVEIGVGRKTWASDEIVNGKCKCSMSDRIRSDESLFGGQRQRS